MIEYGVKLSQGQMLKLRRGHRISLKHSALRGPHKLMLTEAQVKRLEKAYKAGKGSTLQLEPSQINDNVMGGSVLSTLKSVPRKFARLAMDVGAPVAKALASKAGARLKKKAQDFLMEKGERLVDYGLKKVGAGRGRPRKMKPAVMPMVEGEGFGDFMRGVGKVAKGAAKGAYKVGKAVYENPVGRKVLTKVGEKALDVGIKSAFGGARRRVRVLQPEVEGEGIGDFFKGIYKKVLKPTYSKVLKPVYKGVVKPVAVKVAPKLLDIAVNQGLKKLAGGRVGRPRKMGSGVFAPGMGGR